MGRLKYMRFCISVEHEAPVYSHTLGLFGSTPLLKNLLYSTNFTPPFSSTSSIFSHYVWESSTYLGLPISDRKLRRSDLMTWIEKIANRLPGWKASLMSLAGRAVLVRFVLTAIPIYLLVAIKVPKWFI